MHEDTVKTHLSEYEVSSTFQKKIFSSVTMQTSVQRRRFLEVKSMKDAQFFQRPLSNYLEHFCQESFSVYYRYEFNLEESKKHSNFTWKHFWECLERQNLSLWQFLEAVNIAFD